MQNEDQIQIQNENQIQIQNPNQNANQIQIESHLGWQNIVLGWRNNVKESVRRCWKSLQSGPNKGGTRNIQTQTLAV